jgi:hypothetical protein
MQAFYRVNQKINESLSLIIQCRDGKGGSPCILFDDLANEFLQKYRELSVFDSTKLTTASFSTILASAGGSNNMNSSTNTTFHTHNNRNRNKRLCLCGLEYHWNTWFYLIPSNRPAGWSPNEKIEKEINEKINKNVELKSIIEKIRTKVDAKDKSAASASCTTEEEKEVFTTISASTATSSSLWDSFIIDGASHIHVCNMINCFDSIRVVDSDALMTGNSKTPVHGYGNAYVWLTKPNGMREKRILTNAAYVPDFYTNLVSTQQLRNKGFGLDVISMEIQRLTTQEYIGKFEWINCLYIVEYNPISKSTYATGSNFPSPVMPTVQSATQSTTIKSMTISKDTWSKCLSHLSDQALVYLRRIAPNISIPDLAIKSKTHNRAREAVIANQIISKQKTTKAEALFAIIHWDIITINPRGFNGDQYIPHICCEFTKIHFIATAQTKTECANNLIYSIKRIERCFPFHIHIVRTDKECSLGGIFEDFIKETGISPDSSTEYMPQQNGAAERAGQIIMRKARMLREEAGFPKELWPDIVKAAAELLNLTPTKSINWQSPLGILYHCLKLSSPTLAYVRNPKLAQGDELESQLIKGYLI